MRSKGDAVISRTQTIGGLAGRLTLMATAVALLVAVPARADDCATLREELASIRNEIGAREKATNRYFAELAEYKRSLTHQLDRLRDQAERTNSAADWDKFRVKQTELIWADNDNYNRVHNDPVGTGIPKEELRLLDQGGLLRGRLKDREQTVRAAMSAICPEQENAPPSQRTASPSSTPAPPSPAPADELDGFPEDVKDNLRRLKGTDPERYRETIKRLRPQQPSTPSAPASTTTTLAPLPPPAIAGLGGIGVPPPQRSDGGSKPPAPLPPVALNTPPNIAPPKLAPPAPLPPATLTGIPSTPDRQLKKITTICQQGPEARNDPQNTAYKCRKVDHVCQPGTKGPNCPPWMHTTDTLLCTTWRAKPEQGDTANCHPEVCDIPSNGIIPPTKGAPCKAAIDPSYLGLKSALLPVQPLPPPQMSHTPAPLPPAVLPPPHIASAPAVPDHVKPQPRKARAAANHRQPPAPRRHVNRYNPQPAANNNDAAIASALIGIGFGAATGGMRWGGGGGGRGGVHRAAPSGHRR